MYIYIHIYIYLINKSTLLPIVEEYGCNYRLKCSTPKVINETTVINIVTTKNRCTLAF